MPELMRAMVLQRPGEPLRLESLPVPRPGPGELLIRVRACAVCRTDLHIVDGELPPSKRPLIPGHEIVGDVAAVGAGLDDGLEGAAPADVTARPHGRPGFRVGERVGVPWLGRTCGRCWYCLNAQENLCDSPEFTGYTRDGGYADYVVADERFCFRLPGDLSDAQSAPLLCAGLIGYRSLRMAGDAERIGIYGFGAAAHIVAQVARHQGRQIFAFTRPGDVATQTFARQLGAVWAGSSEELPPEPLDAALLFAPVGALVPAALRAVRKGGTVVCGGIHSTDIPSFPYSILWGERGVRSVANLTRKDGEEFLELAPQVPIRTTIVEFPLEQANDALSLLRSGQLEGAAVLVTRLPAVRGVTAAAASAGRSPQPIPVEASTWGVVVYEAPKDPHAVAHILVDELGIQPNDALIHARYAPGLLSERLTRGQAERLAARLCQNTYSSEAVDLATLPDFRHAVVSHHLRCANEGLELYDVRGNLSETVPWSRIALISAGLVPLETAIRTDLDDVHFFATARRSYLDPSTVRLPPVMEAWILSADGRLVLRLDQTRLNYDSLSSEMSDSAADNFRKLFERIVSAATGACLTPATDAWRNHASVFKYLFNTTRELQRATLLHWFKLRRGASDATA